MAGMQKTILTIVAVALVGCASPAFISDPSNPQNIIVEKAIRETLKKPKGELTKADLVKVTSLNLANSHITDEGLKQVATLKNLTRLSLVNCKQYSDVGLKEVAKLKNLTYLNLASAEITEVGLKEVAKLGKLNYLNLSYIDVTDAGLKEVAKLEKLTVLAMYQSGHYITVAGYMEMAKLKNLTELYLGYHKITDAGLEELAKLKKLTSLNLPFCRQITKAGVAELQKALPKCSIASNPTK
jgi:internalin A